MKEYNTDKIFDLFGRPKKRKSFSFPWFPLVVGIVVFFLCSGCSSTSYIDGCFDNVISGIRYDKGYVNRDDRRFASERCIHRYERQRFMK